MNETGQRAVSVEKGEREGGARGGARERGRGGGARGGATSLHSLTCRKVNI